MKDIKTLRNDLDKLFFTVKRKEFMVELLDWIQFLDKTKVSRWEDL